MKIKEYNTNELLMIAHNVTGEYTEKKVRRRKRNKNCISLIRTYIPILQYNKTVH